MPETVLEVGDKLHIMTRRLFEEDIRRHFVGVVVAYDKPLVQVKGFAFILNPMTNDYRRLPEERSRIFSLNDSGHIVNKIPRSTEIEDVGYGMHEDRLVVTDGGDLHLSVNEFGTNR